MEFIHRPYVVGETIAAIATPPGEGGIAIIRLSGERALDIAEKVFSGPVKTYATHTAHFGFVVGESGEKIDEALLLVMLGTRSYTGEDTVEIQCHGGSIAAKRVLERVISAGARMSEPGEFTFKAFMNGKLDLTQAEAVQALIGAKSEKAFDLAHTLLEGKLSKKIREYQEEITRLLAIFEAAVDFPEEGLEFATSEEMEKELKDLSISISELIATFDEGKKMKCGISLCIMGAPNVGKSSLMNALLGMERAIVTPIAGTTRDVIEEDLTLNGIAFRLIDTAGVRETEDIVEREGIARAQASAEKADFVLFVLDATREITEEEKKLISKLPPKTTIAIWNKIDRPHKTHSLQLPHSVHLSAEKMIGLRELKQKIEDLIWQNGAPEKGELVLSSQRHKAALEMALMHLESTLSGIKKEVSYEFLTADLRSALFELGTIIGTNITEDVLSSIFSQFCIGK